MEDHNPHLRLLASVGKFPAPSEMFDSEQKRTGKFHVHLKDLKVQMEAALRVSQQPPLPNPQITGTLPISSVESLWTIANYSGVIWNIAGQSALTMQQFQNDLALKTQDIPSYFFVYESTIEMFLILVEQLGSQDKALRYLYEPSVVNPPPGWDVIRAWVVREFLNLYVARGAFRAYGWMNYSGWIGGPYNDPNHLPYRRSPNG